MSGYASLIATITQQIGSLTGLPPHYLGLHGDQPANADGVRAAEAQLASAAYSDQRQLNSPWSRVAQLLSAVGNEAIDPTESNWKPVYPSPEIRTPAQAADAALKQRDIGIPLETVLVEHSAMPPTTLKRSHSWPIVPISRLLQVRLDGCSHELPGRVGTARQHGGAVDPERAA